MTRMASTAAQTTGSAPVPAAPLPARDSDPALEVAYAHGSFGVSRRTFLELAAAAGVTAAGGALVFPGTRAKAALTEPASANWPASLTEEGKVRFTVHSDTHVGAGAENNYAEKVALAFSSIYAMAPTVEAHFFVGDSADTGSSEQYAELADLLNANATRPVGIVMGNHEYYSWEAADPEDYSDAAQERFAEFLASELAVPGSFQIPGGANEGELDCDFIVGADENGAAGYHVLALSAHAGGYDNSYYGDRQNWIREHVSAAVAEDSGKPVFLLTHHPFGNTVWYSEGGSWNGQFGEDIEDTTGDDMSFYLELAAQYPQLIHFSGHTHIPMADPRSIFQDDGFTLIQTATFANNFWMSGGGYDETGDAGGHPDAGQDANQCELVEIDPETNVVTVYRLDFREGAAIGEAWVIDPAAGADGFAYTTAAMEAASAAPVVGEGAEVHVPDDSIAADGASFELTADKVAADTEALANDVVVSYRAEVRADGAAEDAEPAYEARFMSDYYKAAAAREATFARPLFGASLEPDTAYTLRVFAENAFGKEALVGEAEFRTAAL